MPSSESQDPSSQTPTSPSLTPKRASWTAEDDDIMVNVLLEAKSRGEISGSGFKDVVWNRAAAKINADSSNKQGAAKTANKCMDRYGKLKQDFADFEYLKNKTGMGWDDEQKMLITSDEKWEELIAAKPRCKKWRNKSWPLYEKLKELIGKSRATGEDAFHAAEQQNMLLDHSMPTLPASPTSPHDEGGDDDELSLGDSSQSSQVSSISDRTSESNRKRSASPDLSTSRKRLRSKKSTADAFSDAAQAFQQMTKTMLESSEVETALTHALVSFASGERKSGLLSTPERRAKAVRLMEEDEEYSDNEQVSIVELFEQHPEVADSFLAISKKGTRALYIRRALAKYS